MSIALKEFNANSTADRSKMIILLTDGQPFPYFQGHDPCKTSTGYISPTLTSLRELGVLIIAVGIDIKRKTIDEFFKCIVEDFDEHFFYADDFNALKNLVSAIGDIVCNDDIALIINEVALTHNYNNSGSNLFFIELYNPSVGVSLDGFRFEGLINYEISDSSQGISQGQYWVISTYDMNLINQDLCRNCSQDLLIDSSYSNSIHDNNLWWLNVYNAVGEMIDAVARNEIFFPSMSLLCS